MVSGSGGGGDDDGGGYGCVPNARQVQASRPSLRTEGNLEGAKVGNEVVFSLVSFSFFLDKIIRKSRIYNKKHIKNT